MKLICPKCGAQVGEVRPDGKVEVCHARRRVVFEGSGETNCPRCQKQVRLTAPREVRANG